MKRLSLALAALLALLCVCACAQAEAEWPEVDDDWMKNADEALFADFAEALTDDEFPADIAAAAEAEAVEAQATEAPEIDITAVQATEAPLPGASAYMPLLFTFWGGAESGCEWTCEYEDCGVLDAPIEEITDTEEPEGTSYRYYFGIQAPGRAQIIFNYGASLGVSAPARTVICSVDVDAAGNSAVCWAELYADDHMLVVSLPSNPAFGWDWTYEDDPSGTMALVAQDYQPTDVYLEGAGGCTTFELQAVQPGETVLLFNYTSIWDPEAAAQNTYAVVLSVAEDMEITMSIEEQ